MRNPLSRKAKEQIKEQKKQKKKERGKGSNIMKYLDEEYHEIKSNVKEHLFFYGIFLVIFLMIFFQYKYEYKESLGLNKINEEQYFTVLGLEDGASLEEVRTAYKRLVRVWHPDKHINCKSCKEKFRKISEAYEAIIKMFSEGDRRSIFSHSPTILNTNNYHRLVESSDDFWVIFVYNKNHIDHFTNYIANAFNEVNGQLRQTIKFGTIDVSKEEALLVFLPYKFPVLPVIYTHDSRTGINEIFQGIDHINELRFHKFIQECYSSKINLVDTKKIKKILNEVDIVKTHQNLQLEKDLDAKLFIISPKNFIDLSAKDFQKRYDNHISLYQNDLGIYDDTLNLFKDKIKSGDKNNLYYRVYVTYNKIDKKDNNNINLKKIITPIPISVDYREKTAKEFLNIFDMAKKLIMPEINRGNFLKHCKSNVEQEYFEDEKKEKKNICVIEITDEVDILNSSLDIYKNRKVKADKKFIEEINTSLYEIVVNNFEKEKNNLNKGINSKININYGKASLKQNKKLKEFLIEYETKNSNNNNKNNESEYSKKLLIIDLNKHQFLLKSFKKNEIQKMKDFLTHLHQEDFLEDISLGYEYFTDYVEIEETPYLFNEKKIFSIINILKKSIYCQTKPRYLFIWLALFISFMYLFKETSTKSFIATVKMICFSILLHSAIYGYNSYMGNK